MDRPPIHRTMITGTPTSILQYLMDVRKYLRYCPTTIYVEQYFDLIFKVEETSEPITESKDRALELIMQALDN